MEIRGNLQFEVIDKTRKWHSQGCSCWSLKNIGNVNVTINNVLILQPGENYEGPQNFAGVKDYSEIDIEFDIKNDPTGYAPVGGTSAEQPEYLPGDPAPQRDKRLLISKYFIS